MCAHPGGPRAQEKIEKRQANQPARVQREANALSTLVLNQVSHCWEEEQKQEKMTFSKSLFPSLGQKGPRDPRQWPTQTEGRWGVCAGNRERLQAQRSGAAGAAGAEGLSASEGGTGNGGQGPRGKGRTEEGGGKKTTGGQRQKEKQGEFASVKKGEKRLSILLSL